jgi:hypothetical protein
MALVRQSLSGSTNGKRIKVTGTATGSAVTIHTAVSGTASWDQVTLDAFNSHTASVTLTIEWGGTTSPDDLIVLPLSPQESLRLIVDGGMIQNSLLVKAFASTANVVTIGGWFDRMP